MNSLIHKTALILLALLIFGQSMASAQQQDTIKIIEIDKTNFPDITVTVSYIPGQGAEGEPPFKASVENSPIDITNISPLIKPIAAVLVTDLSARMSDKGTDYATRFENMQPFARDFVSQLQGIQAPGSLGSLVVFNDSAKVAQSLTSDLQAINNTLNRADPALIFEPQPLESVDPSSAYPLGEALDLAIAELEKAPEDLPRVLAVFASGDLNQQINSQAFIDSFNLARSDKRPISLVIFGFGSDQEGQFNRFAAQPSALKSLSDQAGGDFISIQGAVVDATTKQEINAIFAKLIGRSNHYKLQLTANNIPAGESELTVSVNGSSDSISENFHDVPPRFFVVSDTRSFQDQVRLTIQTEFEQQPIKEVEYFIDNISLGPPVSNGNKFELVIDAFDDEFQQRFPPGEHVLSAAARDQNGNESRSESELSIVVMEPTTPAWRKTLQEYWWLAVTMLVVIILIGILAIVALVMAERGRTNKLAVQGPQQGYANPSQAQSPDQFGMPEEQTSHYVPQEDEPTARLVAPEEPTELHSGNSTLFYDQEDKTQIYDPVVAQKVHNRWLLHIHNDSHPPMTVELSHTQRHYDIGRVMQHGRQAHIAIDNRLVSQTHAKLELMINDLYLIAENSSNGTFFGPDKERLEVNQRIQLTSGDIFWVSPKVKIVTESIMERA